VGSLVKKVLLDLAYIMQCWSPCQERSEQVLLIEMSTPQAMNKAFLSAWVKECCPRLISGIVNITQQEEITLLGDFPPITGYQNSIRQLICFLQKSLSLEFITVDQNCSKNYLRVCRISVPLTWTL